MPSGQASVTALAPSQLLIMNLNQFVGHTHTQIFTHMHPEDDGCSSGLRASD